MSTCVGVQKFPVDSSVRTNQGSELSIIKFDGVESHQPRTREIRRGHATITADYWLSRSASSKRGEKTRRSRL